jgi:DNA polymerase elongation subunit (family B)
MVHKRSSECEYCGKELKRTRKRFCSSYCEMRTSEKARELIKKESKELEEEGW